MSTSFSITLISIGSSGRRMRAGKRCILCIRYARITVDLHILICPTKLALVAWKQNFFRHLQNATSGHSRLTQALLRQIEQQRNGEPVDSSLLKRVIDSYGEFFRQLLWLFTEISRAVSLGLDEADAQRQMLDVYRDFFQVPFLEATRYYYRVESEAFVANNTVSDYMKKAESRLQEEADRVHLYLHDSTRKDVSTYGNPICFCLLLNVAERALRASSHHGTCRNHVGRIPNLTGRRQIRW